MNSPATPQVNTLRNLCMILALCVALGCAGHLRKRGYLAPDNVRHWDTVECTTYTMTWIYHLLYKGTGTVGHQMYWRRCIAEYRDAIVRDSELKARRSR